MSALGLRRGGARLPVRTPMLFLAACFSLGAVAWPAAAQPTDHCGGHDICSCNGAHNPYPCCDSDWGSNTGNCTWWAWTRACCVWDRGLPNFHDGHQWDENAIAHDFPVTRDPCAKTIFVCEASTHYCTVDPVGHTLSWGHVGWVRSVAPNGSVDVSEMGCKGWPGVRQNRLDLQRASKPIDFIYKKSTGGQCGCAPGECTPGHADSKSCGNCGQKTRTCGDDCTWGEWSICQGEGPCEANQIQSQACGNCGTRSRSCGEGCEWGVWSSCQGEGICAPTSVEAQPCGDCGALTRVCEPSCQWGAWSACQQGQCAPGESQTQPCGRCGAQARACDATCIWGAWSACAGEGECAAGTVEERPCCDCGVERRSCNSFCEWEPWSACAGADPAGPPGCDTGLPSFCAEGELRCVSGCLDCVPVAPTRDELCDELDNDCDAQIDEEMPAVLGVVAPRVAAQLVDSMTPAHLAPGEQAEGWALFKNVGQEPWPAGSVWLAALAPLAGEPSALHDPASWPAYDVVAQSARDVPLGALLELQFTVRVPDARLGLVSEGFQLATSAGLIACPAPLLELAIHVGGEWPVGSAGAAGAGGEASGGLRASSADGCACNLGPAGGARAAALLVALVALGIRRRRCVSGAGSPRRSESRRGGR